MSTGAFENWAGTISEIGAIYPFVGSEGFLVVVGVALWIAWHVVQTKRENAEYEEQKRKYGDKATLERLIGAEDPKNP